MTALESYIQSYFSIKEEELHAIAAFFKPVHLKKGDYFLREGQSSKQLAFVQEGILREFLITENKEVTKWIATQGGFEVDLLSFSFNQPARWNIQALTDCELYVISKTDYEKIGSVVSSWDTLEKLFITKCFGVLEDRVVMHLSMTAEERYHKLFDLNSGLFNLVPHQYIASMIGMTPETLSRLRKKSLQ